VAATDQGGDAADVAIDANGDGKITVEDGLLLARAVDEGGWPAVVETWVPRLMPALRTVYGWELRKLVADLTDLARDERDTLAGANLNTMTTVAALGFNDIPPLAFVVAYNLISTPGLVAFTIKEEFVAKRDSSGFSSLIRRMFDEEVIRPLAKERYRHRLSVQGEPLYYVAFVAEKVSDISPAWLD